MRQHFYFEHARGVDFDSELALEYFILSRDDGQRHIGTAFFSSGKICITRDDVVALHRSECDINDVALRDSCFLDSHRVDDFISFQVRACSRGFDENLGVLQHAIREAAEHKS